MKGKTHNLHMLGLLTVKHPSLLDIEGHNSSEKRIVRISYLCFEVPDELESSSLKLVIGVISSFFTEAFKKSFKRESFYFFLVAIAAVHVTMSVCRSICHKRVLHAILSCFFLR